MKSTTYGARLPALRVDKVIREKLEERARALNINLAEAHRQALGAALLGPPVVGKWNVDKNEVEYFEEAA